MVVAIKFIPADQSLSPSIYGVSLRLKTYGFGMVESSIRSY